MFLYAQSFFWGLITAGMALILQVFTIIIVGSVELNNLTILSFFVVILFVFFEEILKYTIVIKKLLNLSTNKKQLVLLSWMSGMGFFLVEYFLLNQKNVYPNKTSVAEIFLLHLSTFGFFGYFVATNKKIWKNFFLFLIPFIVHAFYNLITLYISANGIFYIKIMSVLLFFLFSIILFFSVSKKLAQEQ